MSTPPLNPDRELDEERIRDLVTRSQRAQNDPEELPSLHTSDLVLVNFAGRRLFGRETFASAMAEALASPLQDVRTELEVLDIRFPTRDVAVVSLVKTIHDERDRTEAASELPVSGAMTYVVTRDGDDWLIALAQTTPVL